MGVLSRWLFALKLPSWPKLLVPALLGQGLGAWDQQSVSWFHLLAGTSWTALFTVFVVLLNDVADVRVDTLKRRVYPEAGSAKTIPDGVLPGMHLLIAGGAAGLGGLVLALALGSTTGRPWLFPFSCLSLMVFFGYSFPPLRLNYRGGGELLEALGVGLLLPGFQYYWQSGDVLGASSSVLLPFAFWSCSSALASGLSDELSDRQGGKRTVVSVLGNTPARWAIGLCTVLGFVGWASALWWAPQAPTLGLLVAGVFGMWFLPQVAARLPAATTGAYLAQKELKRPLHHAIWWGGFSIGMTGIVLAAVG